MLFENQKVINNLTSLWLKKKMAKVFTVNRVTFIILDYK